MRCLRVAVCYVSQVLRAWGRLEWDQKLFGAARHLWRLAVDEAFRFPRSVAVATGLSGGAVLHTWAAAEYEADNIRNARIVIDEALRKCPKDPAVSGHQCMMRSLRWCSNAASLLLYSPRM